MAPSVYSHPTVTDPLLKSPKSFYQDPSVLMPKKGFNVSSSGAYFDTSAVSKVIFNFEIPCQQVNKKGQIV